MAEMRLYPISVGRLTLDKSTLTAGRGMGTMITVPVPTFLITHPKGNIVCDTGMHKRVATDPVAQWGEDKVKWLSPVIGKDEDIVSQLAKLGFAPKDIRYVINTHLHLDHAGCNQHFPDSTFLVQKDELRTAHWPEVFQRGSYFRADFDHPLNYQELDGDYDVFGDGTVQLMKTPGHTQGHQSIILTLPRTGRIVLAGDACYLNENADDLLPPGLCWNAEEAVRSLRKLRYWKEQKDAKLFTGHDPELWNQIKHAPDYYD